jgi:glycosyltransferase involved in cell wall biosynthesis
MERRPDIIHFVLPEAYLLGGLAALELDGPALVMSRRSLNLYQRRHRIAARVERFLHRRMAALVGNSQAVLADLRAEGAASDQLHLIPNGLVAAPAGDRGSARARLGVAESPLVLIMVANLIPYKGHADLLAALAGVRHLLPTGWRLLCAGRDDGIGADLRAQTLQLGLANNVLWLGQRNDVPDLLAAADLAISASHEEGSPNAVIEAMAAGLPVVATAAGGAAELVQPDRTGLLAPPRDPVALGAAIMALAADPARRAAMGAAGRAHVAAHHSLDACVRAYAALYHRLAAQVRAEP